LIRDDEEVVNEWISYFYSVLGDWDRDLEGPPAADQIRTNGLGNTALLGSGNVQAVVGKFATFCMYS
jgi:hypothetical protein